MSLQIIQNLPSSPLELVAFIASLKVSSRLRNEMLFSQNQTGIYK